MPLLNTIKMNSSVFNESLLKILITNKITTTLEFLREDIDRISTITKLSLPDILALRMEMFNKYSAPLLNAKGICAHESFHENNLSTGINSLDNIIEGGIPLGYITELCGLSGTGKTQLCLQLSANCAKLYDKNVLYIDTKGDFSATRLQSFLVNSMSSLQELAKIMARIKVIRVWTMEELVLLFNEMKKDIAFIESLKLIVIDSLPCLMFQHLGENCKIGLSFLNIFVNSARYLSTELNLSIICVNIITRWVEQDFLEIEDGESTSEYGLKEKQIRCLGRYWQHIPAIVLLLEKQNNQDNEKDFTLKISATKSFRHMYNDNCILTINSNGVSCFLVLFFTTKYNITILFVVSCRQGDATFVIILHCLLFLTFNKPG